MKNIAVIGSGFVGQATGKGFAKHKNKVTFYDVDAEKVRQLKLEGYNAKLVGDTKKLDQDVIFITVPTLTVHSRIDLSAIESAAKWIGDCIADTKQYQAVVVRSTVLPGTTEGMVLKHIEKQSGKQVDRDFGLAMQPEYLRQAVANSDFERPWFILIGQHDQKVGNLLEELYSPFNSPKTERATIEEAETQKYIHNLYNAVKIAFFNEMRVICREHGLDDEKLMLSTAESCEGIWNPLYGLMDKGPFDGACLPKDTQAFAAWAMSNNHDVRILRSVIDSNKRYAQRVGKNPGKG